MRGGVYPGISANTRHRWDLSTARAELGYEPVLDSEAYADRVEQDDSDVTTCG